MEDHTLLAKRSSMVMFNLWQLFLWKIFFISFSSFAHSKTVSHILCSLKENWGFFHFAIGAFRRGLSISFTFVIFKHGVCPVFSLAVLKISFVEVFFKIMALSVNFLQYMLG